ncbi:MFS transporter [Bradyrhizobium sp. CB82]|uniref:MFS transporter n=1 Tax=Bradyrhizobium sp. CB82 TaxID=3039159 RepID=UPI0024B17D52|nr:MFS transporter [Bradyrhizobium sp. CB82]WFU39572.1 MFS transporter [Bradyrhizobium sp. CB82]
MTSAIFAFAIFAGSAARVLPALLAVPIQQDLGWQTSDVAWPITLGVAVSACASPFAAHGLERWGVRSPLVASLVLLALSLASTTRATSPWHLAVAWGLGVGFSGSLSASLLGAIVGSRGDASHCGTRSGLLASMQLLGSAAGLLVASRAVSALDWCFVFQAAAVGVLATAFAVALVPASGRGATPQKPKPNRYASPCPTGKNWRFWALATVFCICGASTSGLIDGRLGMLCMGAGLSLSSSADVMAIVVIGGAIGSTVSGYLADRYPAQTLLAVYFVLRALLLLWLPFTGFSVVELARFGALYGLDAALTFPALIRLMSGNLGMCRVGRAMGWMTVAHLAGATIASAGVGALGLAAYAVGFACVGLACLVAAGLVVLLRDAPAQDAPSG